MGPRSAPDYGIESQWESGSHSSRHWFQHMESETTTGEHCQKDTGDTATRMERCKWCVHLPILTHTPSHTHTHTHTHHHTHTHTHTHTQYHAHTITPPHTHHHSITPSHHHTHTITHTPSQDVLSEKLDRHDSGLPFRHFLKQETYQMNMSLHTIHSSLLSLLRALDPHSHGDPHTLTSTPHLSHLSLSLLSLTVPSLWLEAVGPTSPPSSWPLQEWVQDLAQRWVFLDQLLSLGLGKVPTYWLGAFFHPDAFLSVLTQVRMYMIASVDVCMYTVELLNQDVLKRGHHD